MTTWRPRPDPDLEIDYGPTGIIDFDDFDDFDELDDPAETTSITAVTAGHAEAYLAELMGRSRPAPPSLPPARLEIELIPQPLWGQSIAQRYREQWDKLRRPCYRCAGWRCEICRGKGPEWPVEAHEIWKYDIAPSGTEGVQRLVRLIALCPKCHQCKHMGRSGIVLPSAEFGELLDHFCQVNGWGRGDNADRMLREHMAAAEAQWEHRNQILWRQDLSAFRSSPDTSRSEGAA
jgi:5-methylcytosine-specific restriction endonuclease McrA